MFSELLASISGQLLRGLGPVDLHIKLQLGSRFLTLKWFHQIYFSKVKTTFLFLYLLRWSVTHDLYSSTTLRSGQVIQRQQRVRFSKCKVCFEKRKKEDEI